MLTVDVRTIASQVRAILVNPDMPINATGDGSLDKALTTLSEHLRSRKPLVETHTLGYWAAPTTAAHASDC